jgi:TetR/AcrR family transcriptional regulator of autoinduction and epiphytic fitness
MKEKAKTLSERKREDIVSAAKRAFLAHGVQGTSMDKLAEMAEVSKRTVYNHFSNKEELVLQMLTELWTRTMVDVDVSYTADRPLQEQLLELVEAEIELVSGTEFLGLSRAAANYYMFQPEKLQEAMTQFPSEQTALHRWLQAATDDGRLRHADVAVAFDQLHSLVKGTCYWPQLLGIKPAITSEEKKRLADESVAMFLDHYQTRS